jgi:hypothetical protein
MSHHIPIDIPPDVPLRTGMARGKDVLDAIDNSPSLRSRTLLSEWMRSNHDAFEQRLSKRVANWKVLTDLFAADGLTDRYGNKPRPETARKMWLRIRKEVAEDRAKRSRTRVTQAPAQATEKRLNASDRSPPPPESPVATTPPPVNRPAQAFDVAESEFDGKPRFSPKPATMLSRVPKPPTEEKS